MCIKRRCVWPAHLERINRGVVFGRRSVRMTNSEAPLPLHRNLATMTVRPPTHNYCNSSSQLSPFSSEQRLVGRSVGRSVRLIPPRLIRASSEHCSPPVYKQSPENADRDAGEPADRPSRIHGGQGRLPMLGSFGD